MTSLYCTISKICAAGLFAAAIIGFSGCSTHGTVAAAKIDDKVTIAPELKALLAKNPHPSIVLRIPSSAPGVTQSETVANRRLQITGAAMSSNQSSTSIATPSSRLSASQQAAQLQMQSEIVDIPLRYADSIYDAIEQEFVKAGFIVRDRQMLNTLLEKTDSLPSYAELGRRLQADIIIEITGIGTKDFWQSEYTDAKGVAHDFKLSNKFDTPYRTLSGKLIITSEGSVGGFFTFNYGGEGGKVLVSNTTGEKVRFQENPWKKYIQEHPEEFRDKAVDTKDTWKPELVFPAPNNNSSAIFFAQKRVALLTTANAATAGTSSK